MRMKNKKGQLGKLIISFPLMILIFVMMGIFIFLSSTFSMSKGVKESPNFVYQNIAQHDLMSERINAQLNNGKTQEMLVLDAIARNWTNEITKENICAGLTRLFSKMSLTKQALFIFTGRDENPKDKGTLDCYLIGNPGSMVFDNTDTGKGDSVFKTYANAGAIRHNSFYISKIPRVYVDYYFGEALG
jgi:hypothetical protein